MTTEKVDDPTDTPSPNALEHINDVRIDDVCMIEPTSDDEGRIVFELADGRVVSLPLSWSWRLQKATPAERRHFEISPSGYGVHWPHVDEDLSARGALRGTPAPKPGSAPPPYMPEDSYMPGGLVGSVGKVESLSLCKTYRCVKVLTK